MSGKLNSNRIDRQLCFIVLFCIHSVSFASILRTNPNNIIHPMTCFHSADAPNDVCVYCPTMQRNSLTAWSYNKSSRPCRPCYEYVHLATCILHSMSLSPNILHLKTKNPLGPQGLKIYRMLCFLRKLKIGRKVGAIDHTSEYRILLLLSNMGGRSLLTLPFHCGDAFLPPPPLPTPVVR